MKILLLSIHKSYDNRIFKHITSLLKKNYEVSYFNATDDEYNPSYSDKISYLKIKKLCYPKKKPFGYLYILVKMAFNILKSKVQIVHIHDNLLLPLTIFCKLKGMKIVYDKHELYEEVSKFHKCYENFFSKFIDYYVLVSEKQIPFLQKIKKDFIYKIIPNYQSKDFYNQFTISNEREFTVIYIGSLNESDRDIDSMLYIFESILQNSKIHVIFGGIYASEETLQKVDKLQKFRNFTFVQNIPYEEVAQYTKNSDVGLWLLKEHVDKNASPNKVYENLICGNVIISRSGFKVSELIEDNGAGKTFGFDKQSNDKIIEFINNLERDSALLLEYKNKSKQLGEKFCWENEELKYFELYKDLV